MLALQNALEKCKVSTDDPSTSGINLVSFRPVTPDFMRLNWCVWQASKSTRVSLSTFAIDDRQCVNQYTTLFQYWRKTLLCGTDVARRVSGQNPPVIVQSVIVKPSNVQCEKFHHSNLYTVSQKNDNDVLRYNFNAHQPILIIFGRDIAEWICY